VVGPAVFCGEVSDVRAGGDGRGVSVSGGGLRAGGDGRGVSGSGGGLQNALNC
jgi:hypothetical protein